jgi:hypothetical protein
MSTRGVQCIIRTIRAFSIRRGIAMYELLLIYAHILSILLLDTLNIRVLV